MRMRIRVREPLTLDPGFGMQYCWKRNNWNERLPGVVLQPVHQHHQELVSQILQGSRHLRNRNYEDPE
jgi:hypothetical protein